VSHSPYWKDTAIFITEDDAQNGPDHVDAHRTESLVISPYTARSDPYVDHTLYDTAAMVRTIELILGLPPLSQFDANAAPMWRVFTSSPDLEPYSGLSESIPVTLTNTLRAYGAHASARMNFSREDLAPAALLNRVLWHAIKGARTPYPAIHGGVGRSSGPAALEQAIGALEATALTGHLGHPHAASAALPRNGYLWNAAAVLSSHH
jgi:hypothetical protein